MSTAFLANNNGSLAKAVAISIFHNATFSENICQEFISGLIPLFSDLEAHFAQISPSLADDEKVAQFTAKLKSAGDYIKKIHVNALTSDSIAAFGSDKEVDREFDEAQAMVAKIDEITRKRYAEDGSQSGGGLREVFDAYHKDTKQYIAEKKIKRETIYGNLPKKARCEN
jgi:hypothetical protein